MAIVSICFSAAPPPLHIALTLCQCRQLLQQNSGLPCWREKQSHLTQVAIGGGPLLEVGKDRERLLCTQHVISPLCVLFC